MKKLIKSALIAVSHLAELKEKAWLSAVETAKHQLGVKAELITSRENVSSAARYLRLTGIVKPVNVVSVQGAKREAVYCLTTDNHGCFALANGVIVSNCDAIGYFIAYEHSINKNVTRVF